MQASSAISFSIHLLSERPQTTARIILPATIQTCYVLLRALSTSLIPLCKLLILQTRHLHSNSLQNIIIIMNQNCTILHETTNFKTIYYKCDFSRHYMYNYYKLLMFANDISPRLLSEPQPLVLLVGRLRW